MRQKIEMLTACAFHDSLHRPLRTILSYVAMAVVAFVFAGLLTDIEVKRQLLAGSDALLERMVIPPNRPDWVTSDCSKEKRDQSYDRGLCQSTAAKN